jgi:hypothetical protein
MTYQSHFQPDPELEQLLAAENPSGGPSWPGVMERPRHGQRQVLSARQLHPGDRVIIHILNGEILDLPLTVAIIRDGFLGFHEWKNPRYYCGYNGHFLSDLGIEPYHDGGWHYLHYVLFAEAPWLRLLRRIAWRLGYHS